METTISILFHKWGNHCLEVVPLFDCLCDFWKRSVIIPYLDFLISALDQRFSNEHLPAFSLMSIHPSSMLNMSLVDFKEKSQDFCQYYDLPIFEHEAKLWYKLWGKDKGMEREGLEKLDFIRSLILEDRRIKVRETADIVGISTERVHNILHEKLAMKKLSSRWVPHLLNDDQKRVRMEISQQCLNKYNHNPQDFLRRFISVDKTWIHHYTPETKQQSKQWTKSGERPPKKAKTVLSAGKVMTTVLWDSQGIILVDYLEKGKTISSTYYASLLDKLNGVLKTKRPR